MLCLESTVTILRRRQEKIKGFGSEFSLEMMQSALKTAFFPAAEGGHSQILLGVTILAPCLRGDIIVTLFWKIQKILG